LDKIEKIRAQKEFQLWVEQMDSAIAEFVASAPLETRGKLDLSDESLDVLEVWILSMYSDLEHLRPIMDRPDVASFMDGASRYLGAIFRRASGSSWVLELDDPKSAAYNRPSLWGGTLSVQSCPWYKITAATDRRTGKYFSTILRNLRDDNALKIQHEKLLVEKWQDVRVNTASSITKSRLPFIRESDGGGTYATLVLIDESVEASADELASALETKFPANRDNRPEILRHADTFKLSWPEFTLFISRDESPHVIRESAEMAENLPPEHPAYAGVASCKARYDISATKDDKMENFNFYVFVVEAIESLGRTYTFDPIDGKFTNL
jgi:hypothetical protein